MCVMFDVSDRVRRAYTVAMVFVCLWVTAANIALFIAYLSTNGNFQFDVVNLIYIVGVVLDLTFCVASDILYIRALVASQRFRPAGKGPSVDEILILCNIAFITAIQAISITLLFVGVDQEYAYHVCTTAIRIRFFAFVVQFTEDVLSDNGAVSNAKGVTSVSVFDRFKQPSVLTHPRPMSDVGNERQVGPVV
ncbi:hypothetical protein HK104_002583 [Borealophlyctis nickersoniae]|nr:hypothetical protein HK104_002583 [Borealophlyctis nickersoniae]